MSWSAPNSVLRLAVVGLGFMGRRHLEAIAHIPDIEPRVIHGADVAGALHDPEIDAVDLCIPTDLHASVAVEALRAGKHVMVEKPMALDVGSCNRMIAEAERHDRVLMVAHVLRFSPAYIALERRLTGETVRAAAFQRRCGRPDWAAWLGDPTRSGGGVFDLLIHDADMTLHLFGAPQAIAATGSGDLMTAQLYYANHLAVEISGGWYTPGFPFSMEYLIATDRSTLHYNSLNPAPEIEPADAYADEIAYFAECVREHKQPARCPPRESAEAVRLTLALIAARKRNGEKIAWTSE